MTTARLGGLAVAGLLALSGAAAADCATGSESVDILAANLTDTPVAVSIRQGRSNDPWQTLELPPGDRQVVAACLQMVLSVASAEYSVADGAGTVLCSGDNLIPAGAGASLVIEAGGACALKVQR